jgi:hypothetical protein
MSTISGEESVRPNPAPRQTRPGLTGRKLVLMCANEHRIPEGERQQMNPWLVRCKECGTTGRRWVWLCAPLWLEGWEWLIWGMRNATSLFGQKRGQR